MSFSTIMIEVMRMVDVVREYVGGGDATNGRS